jgi:DNA-binding MarR family transcriptional regulator
MGNVSTIQAEIRQTRPFKSRRQEALVTLARTQDDVSRYLGSLIGPAGITLQQYNVLRILRGAGGDPLPTLEIGERMLARTPGITRLLDRLEERALVERKRCSEDRRRVLCTITKAGLELLASLDDVVDQADRRVMGHLTETELATLIDALDRIRVAVKVGGSS